MKKKIFGTVILIFLGFLWSLTHTWGQYLIDMQYSTNIAPDQFNDDTMAYQLLKNQHHFNGLVDTVYYVGLVLIIVWIVWIWVKYLFKK